MKKWIVVLVIILIGGMSCKGRTQKDFESETTKVPNQNISVTTTPEGAKERKGTTAPSTTQEGNGVLTQLKSESNTHSCCTENGFYYISSFEDKERNTYYSIHYIDFSTGKEVVLCNKPECKHNDDSCNAFIPFYGDNIVLFTDQTYLYLLYTQSDAEMSMMTATFIGGEDLEIEEPKAYLYRMNLDGTDGKKVFEFAQGEKVNANIFADKENLYFYTKKLDSMDLGSGTEMTTVNAKNLVKLSKDGYQREDVMDLENDQQVIGCTETCFILTKEVYDSQYTKQQIMQDDTILKEAMDSQVITVSKYDLSIQKETFLKEIKEKGNKTVAVQDGIICYGVKKSGKIMKIDANTGKESELAKTDYEKIVFHYGEFLICDSYDRGEQGRSMVINVKDGSVKRWSLKGIDNHEPSVLSETKDNFVMLQAISSDSKPTFALMSKQDFSEQKNHYKDFQMLNEKGAFVQ